MGEQRRQAEARQGELCRLLPLLHQGLAVVAARANGVALCTTFIPSDRPNCPCDKVPLLSFPLWGGSSPPAGAGDVVTIKSKAGEWWEGEVHGRKGYFPASYVQPYLS